MLNWGKKKLSYCTFPTIYPSAMVKMCQKQKRKNKQTKSQLNVQNKSKEKTKQNYSKHICLERLGCTTDAEHLHWHITASVPLFDKEANNKYFGICKSMQHNCLFCLFSVPSCSRSLSISGSFVFFHTLSFCNAFSSLHSNMQMIVIWYGSFMRCYLV